MFVQVLIQNISRDTGNQQYEKEYAAPLTKQPLRAEKRRRVVSDALGVLFRVNLSGLTFAGRRDVQFARGVNCAPAHR